MSNPSDQKVNTGMMNLSKLLKRFIFIIPIGVIINLWLTFSSSEYTIFRTVFHFSSVYLSIVILLTLIPWFANTMRLYIWTKFLNTQLTFLQVFKIIIISECGAAITPSAVGSAPVKTSMLIEKKMAPGTALTVATITSVEDLTFFIFAIPIALTISSAWNFPILKSIFEKFHSNMSWILGAGIVLMLFILCIRILWKFQSGKTEQNSNSFIQRATIKGRGVWKDFRHAYYIIRKKGKTRFMTTTLLTGLQWVCRYSIVTALVRGMGFDADPILFFALQWIIFMLSIFIPTPGATGGAEASFYFIFYGLLPVNMIGMITAGWRLLSFYLFLGIGALLYAVFSGVARLTKKVSKSETLALAEI